VTVPVFEGFELINDLSPISTRPSSVADPNMAARATTLGQLAQDAN